MQSRTLLTCYGKWISAATLEQIAHVDAIFKVCEDNYDAGGDVVVESFSPEDVLAEFVSVDDAKAYCGIRIEASLNARWGDDDDPELARAARFDEW